MTIHDQSAGDAASPAAMTEAKAKSLLAEFGVAVPRSLVVERGERLDPVRLDELRPPYVCKLLAGQAVHKSDIGGVKLGLEAHAAVVAAIGEIGAACQAHGLEPEGFLVEEQAEPGLEMVVGGLLDPRFGPCVMVGLGGIFVEMLEDVSFRVAPIDRHDARQMLAELKAAPMLKGARGRSPYDEEAVVDLLMAIGGADGLLCRNDGAIAEIDINPFILHGKGGVAVDARIVKTGNPGQALAAPDPLDRPRCAGTFRPLFSPRSIAVIGASASGTSFGNEVIRHSRALGFSGRVIPIHPKADMVEGARAVASLGDLSEPVDFAYVAIGAEAAIAALEEAKGKVRFVQVMSSGFGETPQGERNQQRLVEAARNGGMRLIGPNCLGVHSPRGGLTFVGDASSESGPVGIISQSGGLAVDVILRGQSKGLRFAAVTTLGNSADLAPVDFLEYHLSDPGTEVIGLYIEDVRDGRRFVSRLREAGADKPIVVLAGGRTSAGQRAAASHTGSLAADSRLWEGLARQTGVILTETLNEFLDALLAFQMLAAGTGPIRNVALFGNGGGTSVLAADALGRLGLSLPAVRPQTRARLDALALPPGTGLDNPIDTPAGTLRHRQGAVAGEILDILMEESEFDALIVHVNLTVFASSANQEVDVVGNIVRECLRIRGSGKGATPLALVLRSDGTQRVEDRKRVDRDRALRSGIPVFDELPEAAAALAALATWRQFRFEMAAR